MASFTLVSNTSVASVDEAAEQMSCFCAHRQFNFMEQACSAGVFAVTLESNCADCTVSWDPRQVALDIRNPALRSALVKALGSSKLLLLRTASDAQKKQSVVSSEQAKVEIKFRSEAVGLHPPSLGRRGPVVSPQSPQKPRPAMTASVRVYVSTSRPRQQRAHS